jgi:hypothetical protein
MTPLLSDAIEPVLRLATHGWRLFPCVARAKTPLMKGWSTLASSSAATIRKWAIKHPGCNWAVACGPESGVWVLDIDGDEGRGSLATLEAQHGRLPDTLASCTGREDGGEHRWFTWSAAHNIRNSTSKLAAGLDIRGAGGYAIIPPSRHPNGPQYVFTNALEPASAPDWLLREAVTARERLTGLTEVSVWPEGRRNDGLTRLAGAMRRKGNSLAEIEGVLLEHNCRRGRPPLKPTEVLKIAASVARYAPGGPDPLERAWQAVQGETNLSRYERFLGLACQLQLSRPDQTIALPLERIAALMGIHYTMVSLYRKRAVTDHLLEPAEEYVPHRRAGLYRVSLENITKNLTKNLTSGLVRILKNSPSETSLVRASSFSPSESERQFAGPYSVEAENGKSEPRCYIHKAGTEWWKRADGGLVCQRCHPNSAGVL